MKIHTAEARINALVSELIGAGLSGVVVGNLLSRMAGRLLIAPRALDTGLG
jgi:hypothetical protein